MLIDTGSEKTLLNVSKVKQFPLKSTNASLKSVTGHPIKVYGTFTAHFIIQDKLLKFDCLAVDLNIDGVFGLDFFREYDMTLNCKQRSIDFIEKKI